MLDLSVIILNYNTADYLKQCLNSIKKQLDATKTHQIEIIVVDNHSSDESVRLVKRHFPWVKLIVNQKNLGFAAGNNVGIKKADGRYIMLLNSDTKIINNVFRILINFMDKHPQAGAITPLLQLPNGKVDLASHRGFPSPWAALSYFLKLESLFPHCRLFAQYHQTWKDMDKIHQVDAIAGAAFLFRSSLINKTGYLDERFFMYAEDLDYFLRIKKKGFKIYFHPQAHVIHFKKRSGRAKSITTAADKKLKEETRQHFYQTMKLFYDKHYRHQYPGFVRKLVLFTITIISKVKH